jgi:murein L,D-transpeptidase YcbB/YkuD
MAADAAAMSLAHDYLFGRVSDRQSMGWLIERSPYEAQQLPAAIRTAVADGRLAQFMAGLLPQDARYAAFRDALAQTSDPVEQSRLRANMERARWMPRTAERDYLYVNVPSYQLAVVSDGQATSVYPVVVGARDTPTPQMISPTSSLVVNPWWNVPQSIVRKSNMRPGRAGFRFTRLDGGQWAVRQPPGPRNALGRIKFNLVNDQAIYLHDTPAKAGFARDDRALSHGCIRVKNINQLAEQLMSSGDTGAGLDTALASSQTETLRLPQTWPVYIVYFTEDLGGDGSLQSYSDPYDYDARIVAALDGSPLEVASR